MEAFDRTPDGHLSLVEIERHTEAFVEHFTHYEL
jgi:hypothetical protein